MHSILKYALVQNYVYKCYVKKRVDQLQIIVQTDLYLWNYPWPVSHRHSTDSGGNQ